jgi:phage replication O-like protein O
MPNPSNNNHGSSWIFSGFSSPNTTPVPDEVFDVLAPRLREAELRVLLYIIRRTFGFKKESDNISLKQMVEGITTKEGKVLDTGTGLSKPAVTKAVQSLVKRKIVMATNRRSFEKGDEPTTYKLNIQGSSSRNEARPVLTKLTRGSKPSLHGGVNEVNTQETVIQETVVQNTVNGVVKGEEENVIKRLKNINQPKEKTEYVAEYITRELGDKKSERFYKLIAAKIPEQVIRQALSEIKADGARNPAKLFTYKMKQYALKQNKRNLLQKM